MTLPRFKIHVATLVLLLLAPVLFLALWPHWAAASVLLVMAWVFARLLVWLILAGFDAGWLES